VTTSPPEAENAAAAGPVAEAVARNAAELVGSSEWSANNGTAKVKVVPERWVDAVRSLRGAGFGFFSFLSAVDWSREVQVGEKPTDPELSERVEVICRLSTTTDNRGVVLSTDLSHSEPVIDSLVEIFPGADWHEREAHEMFGIDFRGHPNLAKLYLPDAFEGFPLRKSFPLLSRQVRPWPGAVDVEGMPGLAEEAEATDAADEEGG